MSAAHYPEGFAWGFTWSATQAEGVAPAADWARWERLGLAPASGEGAGFRSDARDDLLLMAELGANAVRCTIEWARIEPQPGKVDNSALDWYIDMVRSARAAGLSPWLTLQSTTCPGWFSDDEAGFRDRSTIDRFWLPHVERCAEAFSGLAAGWTPIDDPVGWALRGYLLGTRPPGKRDPQWARDAIGGALAADHRAAQLLASGRERTMAVRHVPTVFAVEKSAVTHATRWRAFLLDSWAGLLFDGVLALPDQDAETHPEWVGDFDAVGLNWDGPIGITDAGALAPYPTDGRSGDNGYVPLADELQEQLSHLAERVDRPLAVSANGLATTDDEWRESELVETVAALDAALVDGVNLVGYFYDTAIDGYEFKRGFTTERGLIDRDRSVKDSGVAFQRLIAERSTTSSS